MEFTRVRQKLYSKRIDDIPGYIHNEMQRIGLAGLVKPGQRIALTCGSRGVANIALVIKSVAAELRGLGAEPFVVPTMGSHGGATGPGQREVVCAYGVTTEYTGCDILSDMDVVQIGETPAGVPVYLDKNAAAADGIIVIGRVKKHTDFTGPIESGLMKMMCIGLGKRKQAEAIHAFGTYGLRNIIPTVSRVTLQKAKILFGLALLENGYDDTSDIEAILPRDIEEREKQLLRLAKRRLPRLPWDDIDILIVDQLGKDVSGCGMDTNVIGRMFIPRSEPEFRRPRIKTIGVLDLTEETHGNACGLGLADLAPQRFFDKIDWHSSNTNVITSGFMQRGKCPVILPTDKDVWETAMYLARHRPEGQVRAVRIKNTLLLEEVWASPALVEASRGRRGLTVVGDPAELRFDEAGNMLPLEPKA